MQHQGAMISARVLSSFLLSHLSHLCGNHLIIYLSVYLVRLYVVIPCSMNGSSCVGRSLTPCRTIRTVNVSKVMSMSVSSLRSSLWIYLGRWYFWITLFLWFSRFRLSILRFSFKYSSFDIYEVFLLLHRTRFNCALISLWWCCILKFQNWNFRIFKSSLFIKTFKDFM